MRHKVPFLHQAIIYRRQRIMRNWDRAEVIDMPFIEKTVTARVARYSHPPMDGAL